MQSLEVDARTDDFCSFSTGLDETSCSSCEVSAASIRADYCCRILAELLSALVSQLVTESFYTGDAVRCVK